MDDDPAPGRAAQEGLLARARGRARARRRGLGDGLGGQHRGDDGVRAAAASVGSRAWSARASRRRSRGRARRPSSCVDAGRQRRVHARDARAVRPDGERASSTAPLRRRATRASGCSRSARSPTKGTPLVKEAHELLGRRERRRLLRQRRGPRPHRVARRRDRDRRLHRQRRAQDPRGRAARSCSPPCSRVIDTDDATQAAGATSSWRTSLPARRGPRPRRPGRGDAAGRRRGLRHLATAPRPPRAIKNALRVAHDLAAAGSSTRCARPIAPRECLDPGRAVVGRLTQHTQGGELPAETHNSAAGARTATAIFELIRDQLRRDPRDRALRGRPRTSLVRRRPRRGLARPDRAGRGARRGALASGRSASGSTTRTSRT